MKILSVVLAAATILAIPLLVPPAAATPAPVVASPQPLSPGQSFEMILTRRDGGNSGPTFPSLTPGSSQVCTISPEGNLLLAGMVLSPFKSTRTLSSFYEHVEPERLWDPFRMITRFTFGKESRVDVIKDPITGRPVRIVCRLEVLSLLSYMGSVLNYTFESPEVLESFGGLQRGERFMTTAVNTSAVFTPATNSSSPIDVPVPKQFPKAIAGRRYTMVVGANGEIILLGKKVPYQSESSTFARGVYQHLRNPSADGKLPGENWLVIAEKDLGTGRPVKFIWQLQLVSKSGTTVVTYEFR